MKIVLECGSLKDVLSEAGWPAEIDSDTGDICSLYFDGEKLGSEEEWMGILAPYVENGSYIEVSGEEDSIWRWCFNNGKLETKEAVLAWEDYEQMLLTVIRHDKDMIPALLGLRPDLDRILAKILGEEENDEKSST